MTGSKLLKILNDFNQGSPNKINKEIHHFDFLSILFFDTPQKVDVLIIYKIFTENQTAKISNKKSSLH